MPVSSQWFANPSSEFEIDQSCRFNDDDSPTMTRTPGSSGNTNTWTLSFWVKRCAQIGQSGQKGIFSAGDGGGDTGPGDLRYDYIGFNGDKIAFATFNGFGADLYTDGLFRDPTSWYHIVLRYDDTQGTATDRVRIYVNGVLQTLSITRSPDEDKGSSFNAAYLQRVIGTNWDAARKDDCYLAEMVMIDGSSLAASSFGETNSDTGQWVAKDVSGLTFGTNGFHLKFQDSSALGDDTSGNGNDFSTSGLAANDQMSDSPTNNYCTWNYPLQTGTTISSMSNGNLVATGTSGAAAKWMSLGTMSVSSGKWYFEITSGGDRIGAGFTTSGSLTQANLDTGPADVAAETFYIQDDGTITYGTTTGNSAPSFGSGVTMGFALDADAGKAWVTVNGSDWADSSGGTTGDPTDGSNPTWTQTIGTPVQPLCGDTSGGSYSTIVTANFGQSSFSYTPPTGYKAWNTSNLPEPTIVDPSAHFQTTIYTGNGDVISVDQSGNSTFQPEVAYIKGRSGSTYATNPQWCDTILGTGWRLQTDDTDAKGETGANGIKSFDSDGFTVGENEGYNEDDALYVGWQWDEGTTPGFDMVAYTGTGANRTVSHGLGVVPEFFIVKRLDASGSNWGVYHKSLGNTKSLFLQSTGAAYDSDEYFNDTSPTSSVITLGTNAQGNTNTGTYTAWIWAGVEGFSKFGKYTGNNNANGPFVHTGFRPGFILTKRSDTSGGWEIHDDVRSPFNVCTKVLYPYDSSGEATDVNSQLDICASGFKFRGTATNVNASGGTYVYAAWAHSPFKTANAR